MQTSGMGGLSVTFGAHHGTGIGREEQKSMCCWGTKPDTMWHKLNVNLQKQCDLLPNAQMVCRGSDAPP